jgi:hypothetical protein
MFLQNNEQLLGFYFGEIITNVVSLGFHEERHISAREEEVSTQ